MVSESSCLANRDWISCLFFFVFAFYHYKGVDIRFVSGAYRLIIGVKLLATCKFIEAFWLKFIQKFHPFPYFFLVKLLATPLVDILMNHVWAFVRIKRIVCIKRIGFIPGRKLNEDTVNFYLAYRNCWKTYSHV